MDKLFKRKKTGSNQACFEFLIAQNVICYILTIVITLLQFFMVFLNRRFKKIVSYI